MSDNKVHFVTQGTDLSSKLSAEFGPDQSFNELGIRAYNPDELENNLVKQLETQMSQKRDPRPMSVFMQKRYLLEKVSYEGGGSKISKSQIDNLILIIEREIVKLRPRRASMTDSVTRVDELRIKIQFLRYLASSCIEPPPVIAPVHTPILKQTVPATQHKVPEVKVTRKKAVIKVKTANPFQKPAFEKNNKTSVKYDMDTTEQHVDEYVEKKTTKRKLYSTFIEDDYSDSPLINRRNTSDARDQVFGTIWQYSVNQGYTETEADEFALNEAGDTLDELTPQVRATEPTEQALQASIADDFKMSRRISAQLFPYQRDAMTWFWNLYKQGTGGILGDEMGLGKTVQVACFLGAMKQCGLLSPSIICCPATTISQWVSELNKWAPHLRLLVMHSAGEALNRGIFQKNGLIKSILKNGDILITTYNGFVSSQDRIFKRNSWGYIILDEGHKIRNPDAEVTIAFKRMPTVHRLILSGTPIQNNLRELWSLFDFVSPGRLGTLPTFNTQFVIPINTGGYANATESQLRMSYQCAQVLKTSIEPFLLRRMKIDVAKSLPKKTDQVLFCNLTKMQRSIYVEFLQKPEIEELIQNSRRGLSSKNTFKYIRALQDICNHPDIYLDKYDMECADFEISTPNVSKLVLRSGKLMVLRLLMSKFKEQGHRLLLFSQGRHMLNVLETFVNEQGYTYLRMDGTTNIKSRPSLVDSFNKDDSIFVFLLTTKVGGLGINLVGANRVVLFDPDWNPSTDAQARERAWRIGQKKDVTVYRLITSGTIEEKMFHRQIFKHYLTNKILADPKQRMQFKYSDMRDLFTLGDVSTEEDEYQMKGFGAKKKAKQSSSSKSRKKTVDVGQEIESAEMSLSKDTATSLMFQHGKVDDQLENDDDNKNILQSLFESGASFRHAFNHDVVERSQRDQRLLNLEAARISRRASETLLREQQALRRDSSNVHIPTWTGINGSAAVFGGSTSSEILGLLREDGGGDLTQDDPHMKLSKELRTYLKQKNRSTADILQDFNSFTSLVNAETFKQILCALAEQEGNLWELKPEFQ